MNEQKDNNLDQYDDYQDYDNYDDYDSYEEDSYQGYDESENDANSDLASRLSRISKSSSRYERRRDRKKYLIVGLVIILLVTGIIAAVFLLKKGKIDGTAEIEGTERIQDVKGELNTETEPTKEVKRETQPPTRTETEEVVVTPTEPEPTEPEPTEPEPTEPEPTEPPKQIETGEGYVREPEPTEPEPTEPEEVLEVPEQTTAPNYKVSIKLGRRGIYLGDAEALTFDEIESLMTSYGSTVGSAVSFLPTAAEGYTSDPFENGANNYRPVLQDEMMLFIANEINKYAQGGEVSNVSIQMEGPESYRVYYNVTYDDNMTIIKDSTFVVVATKEQGLRSVEQ